MKTEKIITLELAARGPAIHIGEAAVAGDYGTRTLKFALTENGEPWSVPDTTRASLAFRTEGGCSGEYDTMPDESTAFAIQGNQITVRLIDQILKNPGWVRLMLILRRDLMEQISAFPVMMTVTEGISGADALPTEYYRVRDLAQVNDALAEFDRRLKEVNTDTLETVAEHNRSINAHADIRVRLDKLANSKLDSDRLAPSLEAALLQAKESGAFNGEDGKTPVNGVDYNTPTDQEALLDRLREELTNRQQLRPLKAESRAWLESSADKNLIYVLTDADDPAQGNLFWWDLTQVEAGPVYKNWLAYATNVDGTPYIGAGGEPGYNPGFRVSSGGTEKAAAGYTAVGFIPAVAGDLVRIKTDQQITTGNDGNSYAVAYFYDSSFTRASGSVQINNQTGLCDYAGGIHSFTIPNYDNIAYFRVTLMEVSDDTVITVNEEITEGAEMVEGYAWCDSGLNITPADYEPRIIELEQQTAENTADIRTLKNSGTVSDGLTPYERIRNWDTPIYDANIPTFRLTAEKPAMSDVIQTPDALYAMYDALMAKYPHCIQKTDLGLCSDGVNHLYRYDFKEPDHRTVTENRSETKAKAILLSGIHLEWAGIFGLYLALEEIMENPALRDLRRNVHLIVIPCANPFGATPENVTASGGQRNANNVEIHRNFDEGWQPSEEGTLHYGGPAPMSEPETRYIDGVLKENKDAAFFMTCHNYNLDLEFGISFLWHSVATAYMCNMGYRLIDRMSLDWMDRFADNLIPGIEEYRMENVESWDTRLGHARISASPGTETKQAARYGIQATNAEICERFHVHGTKDSPEPYLSSFTMSRGCEALVNQMLMCFGCYDPKDKAIYSGT